VEKCCGERERKIERTVLKKVSLNISPSVWTDNRISADSRGRLVAGSFQGHSGHIDGKPSDARFKRPTGVAVDDMGNVYVADTANLAIRKIGESGDQ
jgi:hypothetical protein